MPDGGIPLPVAGSYLSGQSVRSMRYLPSESSQSSKSMVMVPSGPTG